MITTKGRTSVWMNLQTQICIQSKPSLETTINSEPESTSLESPCSFSIFSLVYLTSDINSSMAKADSKKSIYLADGYSSMHIRIGVDKGLFEMKEKDGTASPHPSGFLEAASRFKFVQLFVQHSPLFHPSIHYRFPPLRWREFLYHQGGAAFQRQRQ